MNITEAFPEEHEAEDDFCRDVKDEINAARIILRTKQMDWEIIKKNEEVKIAAKFKKGRNGESGRIEKGSNGQSGRIEKGRNGESGRIEEAKKWKKRRQTNNEFSTTSFTASLVEQGKWLAVNHLKLNEDKTDALLVSSKDNVAKKRIASIPLVVGGASIIPSPVVRNLGVLLDSHLTMEQQINSSCRSSYFHLRRIARINKFLSLPAVRATIPQCTNQHPRHRP
ncbi:hypothetical protein DAPPUDRAFT_106838 [Daphnia pulex]|uniref:Uncharacterized protein n=1 Tax=Daphnia pulex TaxID=6669 RepID=E9GV49_DAPPU|nr:hypothetical protein DAPPUDRAFT_106838 [Daphnia pulex]|eukprot:EFX76673.1 hypothetical protein DAPPUDRAFT_106838 [Daphnia pulex]